MFGGETIVTVNGSPRRKRQFNGLNLHHIDNTRVAHDIDPTAPRYITEKQVSYDITEPKIRESFEKILDLNEEKPPISPRKDRFPIAGVQSNLYQYLEEPVQKLVQPSKAPRIDGPTHLNGSHRRIMNDAIRKSNQGLYNDLNRRNSLTYEPIQQVPDFILQQEQSFYDSNKCRNPLGRYTESVPVSPDRYGNYQKALDLNSDIQQNPNRIVHPPIGQRGYSNYDHLVVRGQGDQKEQNNSNTGRYQNNHLSKQEPLSQGVQEEAMPDIDQLKRQNQQAALNALKQGTINSPSPLVQVSSQILGNQNQSTLSNRVADSRNRSRNNNVLNSNNKSAFYSLNGDGTANFHHYKIGEPHNVYSPKNMSEASKLNQQILASNGQSFEMQKQQLFLPEHTVNGAVQLGALGSPQNAQKQIQQPSPQNHVKDINQPSTPSNYHMPARKFNRIFQNDNIGVELKMQDLEKQRFYKQQLDRQLVQQHQIDIKRREQIRKSIQGSYNENNQMASNQSSTIQR